MLVPKAPSRGATLALFVAAAAISMASARPGYIGCSISEWAVGRTYNMGGAGAQSVKKAANKECLITHNIGSGPYTPGKTYEITVDSSGASEGFGAASKVASDGGGTFGSNACASQSSRMKVKKYQWTAPSSGDVTLRAL